mgnify:CR=1 FL=1
MSFFTDTTEFRIALGMAIAASDVDARTLAAVLGIRYRAVAGGQFFHTSSIVALDPDGRVITRMDGLGDPTPLVTALAD